MKKTVRILALVLAFMMLTALAACGSTGSSDSGKKEETTAATEAEANASPLLGTWENSEYGTAYTFDNDGTGVLTGKGYSMNFTYEDQGGSIKVDYVSATKPQEIEYTINGDTLTLAGIDYVKTK